MRSAATLAIVLTACGGKVIPPVTFAAPCTADGACQAGLFCLPALGNALPDGGCGASKVCSFYCSVTSPYACPPIGACEADACTQGTLCVPGAGDAGG
jgi:hypothetical protein